jgi:hypothetical protein
VGVDASDDRSSRRRDQDTEVAPDRAVVDRIEDGKTAVLLVGADEHELTCGAELLPAGVVEGTWVVLDTSHQPPTIVEVDREMTETRRNDVSRRMRRMREGRRGGRFGR